MYQRAAHHRLGKAFGKYWSGKVWRDAGVQQGPCELIRSLLLQQFSTVKSQFGGKQTASPPIPSCCFPSYPSDGIHPSLSNSPSSRASRSWKIRGLGCGGTSQLTLQATQLPACNACCGQKLGQLLRKFWKTQILLFSEVKSLFMPPICRQRHIQLDPLVWSWNSVLL